ncbi:MAG TPA: Mrp/NBP35 family ATP-binding protein [Thermoanaerobaculia bacterium]|jgi:ATP-binding protein involved in chromosome partitioning|nr:Mrp/NBP35 family ATP-binding protein [Thermoanaerobaculia bacterium]
MPPTPELTEEKVLQTLRTVKFPGLSRDIVSFGFVKDLAVGGGNVSFRLEITTESPRAAEEIERDAKEKLRSLPGVNAVTVRMAVQPPSAAPPRGAAGVAPADAALLRDVRFKVAVASGKGGVGKSTVAANLALALGKLGQRVGLMDSDIYGPSQQMMMGIDEKPFINPENQIVPIERYGVQVMSLGFLMDVDQPVIWRGPMVMKAVEQFLQDVAWGKLDVLLIDLPPGTGDAQLTLTQKIHLSGAVIVTTPQDVSLIDARKGLAMFQKVNVPVLGIIENMSYYICPKCGNREEIFKHGGGERTAKQLRVPFLGEIPLDPKVAIGGDSGRPIVAAEPDSLVTAAYLAIAGAVLATLEGGKPS